MQPSWHDRSGRTWPLWAAGLVTVALLLALRLPTNRIPILNVDEADFVVESSALLDGGRPYIDFVEKKPPLLYVLYAAGLALTGRYNLPALRVLLIPYIALTALLLAGIARRTLGDRVARWVAPLYAVAISLGPPMDFHAANAESLFLLPLVASTWILLPSETAGRRRLVAAGVLVGAASLIKQQAGIQLPILAAFLWFEGRALPLRARAGRVCWLLAGMAAIWTAAIAALAAIGTLHEFYFWTVVINRYYVENGNGLKSGWAHCERAVSVLWSFFPLLWLLVAFGLGALARGARSGRAGAALALTLAVSWFGASLIPVAMGGRFFPHYFLQLMPPAVLLAAQGVEALWARLTWAGRPSVALRTAAAALGLALVLQPLTRVAGGLTDPELLSIPHAMHDAREVAAYAKANTAPEDRLLVWGYGSALYYLAERRPATRFSYVTYLVGAVEATPAWWSPFTPSAPLEVPRAWDLFFEDLERHPPELVIDTAPAGYFAFYKFPVSRYPRLLAYLVEHYRKEKVAGFDVWRRIPRDQVPADAPHAPVSGTWASTFTFIPSIP